jgi:tetratricopeptide (TPR) repeat protein
MSKNSGPIYRRVIQMAIAVLGIISCIFCLWMAALAGSSRLFSAYAADTGRLDGADAALALTPSDPESHLIRGIILKGDNRLDEAISEYEQAVALRPHDYVLWLELGIVRDQAEDQMGAISALKEAVAHAPNYAEPRWQLGNVLLRAGRIDEGFLELRRAAQSKRAFLLQLIDLAWNIYQADVSSIEQAIQPQNTESRLALARFAAKHGKAADGARIFRTIENVAEEDRRSFITDLLAAKQFDVAYEIWSSAPGRKESHSNSGLTDGGFEGQMKLDDPGFGWQIAGNLQAVKLSIDKAQPHNGNSSLRLDWSGDSNPGSTIISQLIRVEPNTRYRLRFAARSEELVTGGPPLLAIIDVGSSDSPQLAQSDFLPSKTAPWQEYNLEFGTTKETQAVLIVLRRQSCSSGPCPIFGRSWLDDFSLQKL